MSAGAQTAHPLVRDLAESASGRGVSLRLAGDALSRVREGLQRLSGKELLDALISLIAFAGHLGSAHGARRAAEELLATVVPEGALLALRRASEQALERHI